MRTTIKIFDLLSADLPIKKNHPDLKQIVENFLTFILH